MIKANILLVEDDENLGFVTQDNLKLEGYKVTWAKDGVAGFEAFCKEKFDLCILDVMLPKKDGFHLGQEIKTLRENIPLIFLTAKSLDPDKVQGFKIGADDYITKPFNNETASFGNGTMIALQASSNTIVDKYVVGHSTLNFFPLLGPIPIVLFLTPFIKLPLTSFAGPSKFTNAVK